MCIYLGAGVVDHFTSLVLLGFCYLHSQVSWSYFF